MLSLVAGGAGFLGSHLVDALIARGDEVIIADNLSTGSLRNIDAPLRGGRATFVYLDVARPLSEIRAPILQAARFKTIGRIFHFASPANPDAYGAHPWEMVQVDDLGTISLVDLSIEQGARLIYASTSEIDGEPLHPQSEGCLKNVDANEPRASFDEEKRFGEAAISFAVAGRGLDARIVRFFNCYGPRMSTVDGRLIAALAEATSSGLPLPIHGDGRQTRSMIFVDDAIRLLLLVATSPQAQLAPVNVGSDDEHTVLEIAETFARIARVPFKVQHVAPPPHDRQRGRPDVTRAYSLGYRPITSLDAGLLKTIAWLRARAAAYA